MREKDLKEDLATLAYKAEADHEVQMARADLYKIAKYSIKLHEMIKGVTELRKKAKNASGERAKMYHWCANMKGGRKKKGKQYYADQRINK